MEFELGRVPRFEIIEINLFKAFRLLPFAKFANHKDIFVLVS